MAQCFLWNRPKLKKKTVVKFPQCFGAITNNDLGNVAVEKLIQTGSQGGNPTKSGRNPATPSGTPTWCGYRFFDDNTGSSGSYNLDSGLTLTVTMKLRPGYKFKPTSLTSSGPIWGHCSHGRLTVSAGGVDLATNNAAGTTPITTTNNFYDEFVFTLYGTGECQLSEASMAGEVIGPDM